MPGVNPGVDNMQLFLPMTNFLDPGNDISPNGLDFTNNGGFGFTFGPDGLSLAATYNGSTDWLERAVDSAFAVHGQDWSVSIWVKPVSTNTRGVFDLFEAMVGGSELLVDDESYRMRSGSPNVSINSATYDSEDWDVWRLVTITYNDTTNVATIIIDDTDESVSNSVTITDPGIASVFIARRGGSSFYSGALQSFLFFDKVLTTDEITFIYNGGDGITTLAPFLDRHTGEFHLILDSNMV